VEMYSVCIMSNKQPVPIPVIHAFVASLNGLLHPSTSLSLNRFSFGDVLT